MALFGLLCFFERGVGPLEVRARILHVGIEKEPVDAVVDIVVMACIAARANRIVDGPHIADKRAEPPQHAAPVCRLAGRGILDDDVEEIGNGAVINDQAALHVSLTEAHLGVENNGPLPGPRCEANSHPASGSVAIFGRETAGVGDRQSTQLDQPLQYGMQQPVHIGYPTPTLAPRAASDRYLPGIAGWSGWMPPASVKY
jgi:hypothetical protein